MGCGATGSSFTTPVHVPPRLMLVMACPPGPTNARLASRGAAMTIVDDDRVEVGNLHRQILHRTEDVGRHKAESAREALLRRWPVAD